jgi:hypothetical protein
VRIAIVNYVWDPAAATPEALPGRFPTLTGWSEAVLSAGAASDPADVVHVNSVLHPRRVRRLRAMLPRRTGSSSPPGKIEDWRRSALVPPPGLPVFDVMEASTTFSRLFRDEARRRSGVDGAPALLWVGRLNSNKDPIAVLHGVSAFLERYPSARLIMVYGEAELEAEVRETIERAPAQLARRQRLCRHRRTRVRRCSGADGHPFVPHLDRPRKGRRALAARRPGIAHSSASPGRRSAVR